MAIDDPIALIEPGRYGDVINVLPLAKHLHDSGEQVDFLIHPKFAGLLDGVSYVRPVLVPLEDEHRPEEARVWAAARYARVIVSKVWNNRYLDRSAADCFAAEAYRLAGYSHLYGKLPVEFDRRSPEREARLVEQHLGGSDPFILYNLDGSSSAFKGRRRFARWLRWQRFDAKLVKMPTDCERLYDLLGLYERADLLITTDTATLWLAHAIHIPTIVLHQTDTWCRAPFPPATVLACTYEGAHSRRRTIAEAIRACLATPRRAPTAACE
ncbi:MAG TPA: hypothetical protein VHY91_24390 [Pirellulales bacterium]|jgi:hypothetical protein|nr:hypothetical protein [Pirellulales bacterium]